ncbi:MAG TPA: Rid family hydrolase [Acidobacteriaceae bacterium]|nr:Rid family hydrolase [Acidobacteriaceae bacterium]
MQFIHTNPNFPISQAVVYSGRILETVLTPIPKGAQTPVAGGPAEEMREIFRQLDAVLAAAGLSRSAIVSARLYLQDVNKDIADVNEVYKQYFASHSPSRRAYGVDLQAGMKVEAAFVAECPAEAGA